MIKELEALEKILYYVNLDEYDYETKGIRNAEIILKKALTPPTAEEVCKELSEYFKKTITYDKGGKYFSREFTQKEIKLYREHYDGEVRKVYVSFLTIHT